MMRREHEMMKVGIAFGSGLLVATVAASLRSRSRRKGDEGATARSLVHETWDAFKRPVVRAAAIQLMLYMADWLADSRERRRPASSLT